MDTAILSGKTVLIFTDYLEIGMYLNEYLSRKGMKATTVKKYAECMEEIGKNHYDLLIADAYAPNGTVRLGKAFLDRNPASKVLMITDLISDINCPPISRYSLLSKPFNPDQIVAALAQLCGA